MLRLAATGLLAAVAVAGLSGCSLAGSAHPTADASTTSVTAQASATPATDATTVTGTATGSPAAVSGSGTGRSPSSGGGAVPPRSTGGTTTGGTTTGGTTTGGTGTGGGSGGGAPAAPSPRITNLHIASPATCPVVGTPAAPFSSPGGVTIAWSVSGASGAVLSVDQPDSYGSYETDLPANGSLRLPFECETGTTTTHTYTIWPAGAHGVSKSITVSAHPEG